MPHMIEHVLLEQGLIAAFAINRSRNAGCLSMYARRSATPCTHSSRYAARRNGSREMSSHAT